MNPPITLSQLKSRLVYNPYDGLFHWVSRHNNKVRTDLRAGTLTHRGYINIRLGGKNIQAHRLAWLYMTGEWPPKCIDHIDLDRSNNRWSNLRLASNSENATNSGIRRSNTSGVKGVSFHKARGKWTAHIRINGKKRYLGLFHSRDLAAQAYADAAMQHHGKFARPAHAETASI